MGVEKITTEDFIRRAKEVHGDKYDYSKAVYVNSKTKVTIICPEHGEWKQQPNNHWMGKGCSKCVGRNRTTKEVIEEAKKVHGDKYDYSKTIYVGTDYKIIIICPVHGEFKQSPHSHLNGSGCPKCIGRNKSTEDFIKASRAIHGDKYDYSKTKYHRSKTRLTITCRIHGDFKQIAVDHRIGRGCPKCAKKYMDAEYFIERVKKVHGDRYDYSKTEFVHSTKKVIITCPIHGDFKQVPPSHLKGMGCAKCARENQSKSQRHTTEKFIERARAIHGDRYDYSKVKYVNATTRVTIICSEHGEFEQPPSSHLNGNGCRKCGGQFMDTEYFIEKSRAIHGDKYDYSKVEYIKNSLPVIIICPVHGEIKQRPANHLNGQGCIKCQGRGLDFLSYEEAKKIVHPIMLSIMIITGKKVTTHDYYRWYDDNKDYCQNIGLPRQPDSYYSRNF